MVTPTNSFTLASFHLTCFIAVFLLQANFSDAQSTTQPPKIEWGRYFDDPAAQQGFNWSKEDLGEKVYSFENNLYILGRTKSDTDAYVNCSGVPASGNGDAFVASYNPVCHTYNWISYFGGPGGTEYAYCGALDKVDGITYIYIAGEVNCKKQADRLTAAVCVTDSGCLSVYQDKAADKWDGFIAKYNAGTGELLRWTYIGGLARDQILAIAVDTITHDVYFNGYTESPSFVNYSAWNFTPYKSDLSGKGDMFIGCFDSCLSSLEYFTYYGGNSSDRGHEIEILYGSNDSVTTPYLVISGTTQSASGIVPDSSQNYYDNTYGGVTDGKVPDAFMLIWNVNHLSSDPDWSTYLGGNGADRGRGISTTSNNDIYWTGQTNSSPDDEKFVMTEDAYQQQRIGGVDCFLAKFHIESFDTMVSSLQLLTYFGGVKDDYAKSVHTFHTNDGSNGTDSVAIAGLTYSADLPGEDSTALFLSKDLNGNAKETKRDAFIAVLTKDPANPSSPQKLSSFAYLGGENDETDIKQNDVLVQKSYNPGLDLGPNGSLFIIYSSKGTRTKKNGKIPIEYSAFHCPDSGCNNTSTFQPDAYFAQVYPFEQHFIEDNCLGKMGNEQGELMDKDVVRFYPVPFSTITILDINATDDVTGEVLIYDLFGRMIMEKKLSLHTGSNKISCDFSGYAAGVYLSRIRLGDEYYEIKITKQ